MLTDRYLDGIPADSRAALGHFLKPEMLTDQNMAHIRALNGLAQRRGQTLAQLALAWVLRDERVTSVLIGASSVKQLEDNAAAVGNLSFTAEELEEIDRYAVEGGINLWQSVSQS
ncbi:MAG: L-glyceraldehyde 3-phosphate reductase [Frankiales bacterium]|nr:L-glyceraldehyde 3-phosphate reductase [Frankiales bacterium]